MFRAALHADQSEIWWVYLFEGIAAIAFGLSLPIGFLLLSSSAWRHSRFPSRCRGSGIEAIQRKLLDLSPQTDAQRWLQSTALQISGSISTSRWVVLQEIGSSIQWPFMAILVFWLAVIFVSFGLFAPRNAIVAAALFVAALSVAGSIYLILAMDQPYSGPIKISSAPLRIALEQLGQP